MKECLSDVFSWSIGNILYLKTINRQLILSWLIVWSNRTKVGLISSETLAGCFVAMVTECCSPDLQIFLYAPPLCPPSLFELMMRCWSRNITDRPTFEGLYQALRPHVNQWSTGGPLGPAGAPLRLRAPTAAGTPVWWQTWTWWTRTTLLESPGGWGPIWEENPSACAEPQRLISPFRNQMNFHRLFLCQMLPETWFPSRFWLPWSPEPDGVQPLVFLSAWFWLLL